MCGIVGIIDNKKTVDQQVLKGMLQKLHHRGPDDEGVFVGWGGKAALGQRRLAIIDLSPGGHQPMLSADGRYIITFNGELYNYLELKNELEKKGFVFRTKSDTEVMLNAFIEWKEKCLERFNGMFAFAIWDEKEQALFAARDALGEKPFKYFWNGDKFIFASELKAILADPEVKTEPDWQAVDIAMAYRFVPAPLTGFKNISKLAAGEYLWLKNGKLSISRYWVPAEHAVLNNDLSVSEWKEQLWTTFKDSVRGRLIADVPVGTFLSGGLDSSSVVAAMAELSHGKVKTFSVGFRNNKDSETPFAKLVADRYKTDHTEIYIEPDIIQTIPELVYHCEEPFYDNAAVPTLAMAKETRKHVTVVLTGDGGDELFGGYTNHTFFQSLSRYHKLPPFITRSAVPAVMKALSGISPAAKKLFYRTELLSHDTVQAYVDYYAIWKKELRRSHFYLTKEDLYTKEMKELVDLDRSDKLMRSWLGMDTVKNYGPLNRSMLADIAGRLSDNYLMKVDYTSMASALENRTPFLDRRLVEMAMSIPDKYKVREGTGKWIWKQVVKDKVPNEIIERRKAGFGIPIGEWMRKDLYDYVRETLVCNDSKLYRYFDRAVIEKLIRDHKERKADYSNHIWCLLLTDQWLKTFFA